MTGSLQLNNPILVAGNDKVACSLTVCLMNGGHDVLLYTTHDEADEIIKAHVDYQHSLPDASTISKNFITVSSLDEQVNCKIAIIVSGECIHEKQSLLQKIESFADIDTIIAINTESIALSELHNVVKNPGRVIGANWVEPVHTTSFLEIITNDSTDETVAQDFYLLAKLFWEKDPYILKSDYGIRYKMMAALIREACFLIENGYATIEDIDRACRNDAGYYLPFAGNFRYMDLMGTNAYGMVMKDLNPALCKDEKIPELVTNIVDAGGEGMANNKGFYLYKEGEVEAWEEKIRTFSHEIKGVIDKYPFNYVEEAASFNKNSYH